MSIAELSGKLGLDTTDFRTAIAAANRELRVIESGFRASAAALGDWGKSMDGLEQRVGALTKAIGLQESKVGALAEEYSRIAAEQGENSKAAQDMLIRLNKETEALNKMKSELSGTQKGLDDMRKNSDKTGKSVEDMAKKKQSASKAMEAFKKTIAGLGAVLKTAVKGFQALGKAAVAATKKAAQAALSLGKSVASAATKIAKSVALLAVGAAVAIGGLLASTIGPASDLAETANKIETVFEGSADAVNKFAANAAVGFGQTKQAALDAAATFGIFGKSAGLSGDELADFSTNLVGLTSDLASFYNTSPEEAADALASALRGQSLPMQKYGVLLNDATLKQKAFEMGLIKTNKAALTPQQKILAANAVILEQTSVAQGDFARTSGGLANQQRILRAQLENMRTTIGTGLLPVVTAGYQAFNRLLSSETVQQGAENLSKALGAIGEAITDAFAGDKNKAIGNLLDGIGSIAETFGVPADAARKFALETVLSFKRVLDMIGQVKQGFMTGGLTGGIGALLKPVREMNPLFDMVGGTIERVVGYFDQFIKIISGSDGDMSKMGEGLGKLIAQIFTDVLAGRGKMIDAALGLIDGLADGIISAIPVLMPIAMSIIEKVMGFITSALPGLLSTGAQLLMTLIDGVVKMLPQLATAAVGIIMTLIKGIIPLLPQLLRAAIQIVVALAEGITQALPELIPAIVQVITEMITVLVENLPLLINAGLQLLLALLEGIIKALPILLEQAPVIITSLLDAIIEVLPMLGTAAAQIILVLLDGIYASLPGLAKGAGYIITSLIKFIVELIPTLWEVGKNIVVGIWEGMTQQYDWFKSQIKGFFSGIVDGVKAALGIESPSTIFAGIGSNMAQGLSKGFIDEIKKVERTVSGAVSDLAGMTPAMAAAGSRITNNQDQIQNYYAPVYYVQPGADKKQQKARRW
jgi:phage-related protein